MKKNCSICQSEECQCPAYDRIIAALIEKLIQSKNKEPQSDYSKYLEETDEMWNRMTTKKSG